MRVLLIGKKNMLYWVENLADALSEKELDTKIFFLNELGFIEDLKRNIFKIFNVYEY